MECSEIRFSSHALNRMFERGMSRDEVLWVIQGGETVADYPDDCPYPSKLILGYAGAKAIHVVVAREPEDHVCFVITAYQPDPAVWSADFKIRRSL